MRCPRAGILVAVLGADRPEAAPDAAQNDGGQDARACYACTSSDQCCAPNLCITINGGPACQVEGPPRTQFTSWTPSVHERARWAAGDLL